MENSYKVIKHGTGHSPHILENINDSSDRVSLCSCGGTKNMSGFCDGTHSKKIENGCGCQFCQKIEDRVRGI